MWLLIYFILPCGAVAFILGCKKHGDLKVAILGCLGLACLITAMIIHELAPKHQHSEEFITIIVTITRKYTINNFSFEKSQVMCNRTLYVS